MTPQMQKAREIYGSEPTSPQKVFDCVLAVLQYNAAKDNNRVVGLTWDVLPGKASNTHSAPHNGVQNFGRKAGKPESYPGWSGRVWVRYENHGKRHTGSDLFWNTMTYTGTGGFGGYGGPWEWFGNFRTSAAKRLNIGPWEIKPPNENYYSWDYRFYDADWPHIYDELLLDILNGVTFGRSRLEWTCDKQDAIDLAWKQEIEQRIYNKDLVHQ